MKSLLGLVAAALLFQGYVIPPSNWIGTYGNGYVNQPAGVAVGADGSSYVGNAFTARIEKFSKAGTHLLGWGGVGGGPGQFQYPAAVAVAPNGEVYVGDVNANRVQRFTANGAYLGEWGSPGTGNGQFADPHGIAISPAGDVYIADSFNHRVQKFTGAGTYVTQWGVQGAGDGQFFLPYGIAVDAKGDVYVADSYNHRIQKFSANGTYLRQWGTNGTADGEFQYPVAITVDAGGNVYVADSNNDRVQRFNSKGAWICSWGVEGNAAGEFQFPQGIACGPNGDVHVSDTANNRMQVFRRRNGQGHEPLLTFGSPGIGNGQFSDPRGVAIAKDGSVYVADKLGCRMQKFHTFGVAWSAAWGSSGSADGQFNDPCGVALDTSGVVYVVDHLNGRVEKFSPAGAFLGKWGTPGGGSGQFSAPWDIAIDDSNRVYVVDAHRVQRFTTDGTYQLEWGCPNASGIGVDGEGYVYVACSTDHLVRKFKPNGTPVLTWGSFGSGVGQFHTPSDVVCDRFGYVYVSDSNGRVQQFTPMGGYIEEWGQPGSALRQLGAPTMMAADTAGNVYVAEFSNKRVQKFASPPELYRVEDVPGDEGGFVRLTFTPSSAESSPGGELYQYRVLRFNPPSGTMVLNFAPGPTSVIVPSGGNATDAFTGVGEYELLGLLAVPGSATLASLDYGYSTDDLAPPAPSPFTAVYEAGATWLHWGVSPATDLDEYRLSRYATQIHASPDTGYADVGPAGGVYSIVAVDTSGNVSPASLVGPEETVDTPPASLAFALDGAVPNPSRALALYFSLPDATPARIELVNVAGRCVWSRDVRGAGPQVVRPAGTFAPGIYFVRLTRGAQALVRRAVVLD